MAINKNHEFEDLGTSKCAIVEKNASPERVQFLKTLLEFNKYEVVVVDSPAPKAAPAAPVAAPVALNELGISSDMPFGTCGYLHILVHTPLVETAI